MFEYCGLGGVGGEEGKRMTQPLAIDLFCGLGGWTAPLLDLGYFVVGFDIEQHVYGDEAYPAHLVVQDVLTLHGSQFKDAALIVASPPCQEYSYMAMPWTKAKDKAKAIRADETGREMARLNRLFNACFRIQRQACEAAGRHVPMVVENVRGAQQWVGRARWNYGSYYLWGDVPALMPPIFRGGARLKTHAGEQWNVNRSNYTGTLGWDTGIKAPGMNWSDPTKRGQDFTRLAGKHAAEGRKNNGGSWFNIGGPGQKVTGQNPDGRKQPGISGPRNNGKGDRWFQDGAASHGSKSPSRKAASAMIAKIPYPLAYHIGSVYLPKEVAA